MDHPENLVTMASGYYEGYWRDSKKDTQGKILNGELVYLPFPVETEFIDPRTELIFNKFISKLLKVESDLEEYYLGNNYLVNEGTEYCVLCNERLINSTYKIKYRKSTLTWPGSLKHYYQEHNVIPSKEFYNAIMGYECFDFKKEDRKSGDLGVKKNLELKKKLRDKDSSRNRDSKRGFI